MKAIVNIGLASSAGPITAGQASAALQRWVSVRDAAVFMSDTEPTLVAEIARPLRPHEAYEVARDLSQQCIAQVVIEVSGREVNVEGELYGPGAQVWRPFNPSYFLGLNGRRLA